MDHFVIYAMFLICPTKKAWHWFRYV